MKKIIITLNLILMGLALMFVTAPSLYAETQEFTFSRELEFSEIDNWKYSMYEMDPSMYIRSPRIQVTEETIKQVQVPNFAIVKIAINSGTYTETIEQSPYQNVYLYFYSSSTAEYPTAQRILTNQGPGALSSYRLTSPYTMVSTRTYVEIVYVMKDTLFNSINAKTYTPLSNWNHLNLQQRLRQFMLATADSFNHAFLAIGGFYNAKPTYKTLNKSYFVTANYEDVTPPTDPEEFDSINDLPESTTGSALDSFNGMGNVYFQIVDGNDIIIKVTYGPEDIDGIEDTDNKGEWYIPISFESGTDMSIFNNDFLSYYYVQDDTKFILINHGNQSMFNAQNIRNQTWIDYSIWNLETNEIMTYERFNVYMYSKMEEASNVYAYFYVDEFIIDRLLTVSLSWKWRYIPFFGNPGSYKYETKVLEAGVTELPADSTHWMFDWAFIDDFDDILPTIFFPGLFIGTTASAYISNEVVKGPISQIEKLTSPSSALLSELNQAYAEAYPDYEITVSNESLYKLYLGQYNAWGNSGIEFDRTFNEVGNQEGINVIQFTYVTEGELYTIEGEDIDVVFVPGPRTDGQSPNFNFDWLSIPVYVWIILGVIAIALIFPILEKFLGSVQRMFKRPILLIVIAAIILIILFMSGVI